jgi:hypothetical protein
MKKDNDNQCDGCFKIWKEFSAVTLKMGQWQHIVLRVTGVGGNHIEVWVDGIKAIDFVDTTSSSSQILSGAMGLYDEDALVHFDNVVITPLS